MTQLTAAPDQTVEPTTAGFEYAIVDRDTGHPIVAPLTATEAGIWMKTAKNPTRFRVVRRPYGRWQPADSDHLSSTPDPTRRRSAATAFGLVKPWPGDDAPLWRRTLWNLIHGF